MKSKEIEKLIKEFLSNETDSLGFNFLKSTQQKKFTDKLPQNKIPLSWKKIHFKLYPRLPQITLKKVSIEADKVLSIIKKRKSERKFKNKSLPLKTISKILYFSCGIRNHKKMENTFDKSLRMYPSAGARYPLEVYPVILKSKEILPGIYHYNVKWNSLELLLKGNFKKKFGEITSQNWVNKSTVIIIITAVFPRTIIKYKERGWRYIFFEAGHLSQNIHLISTTLKLKSCAIGGFLDEEIINLLELNPKNELPLYLITIGK